MNMEIQFLLEFGIIENHKVGNAMNSINQCCFCVVATKYFIILLAAESYKYRTRSENKVFPLKAS